MMMRLFFVSFCLVGVLSAAPVDLLLGAGGRVQGDLVATKANSYFVDLGFTLLEVPKNFVAQKLEGNSALQVAKVKAFDGLLTRLGSPVSVSVDAMVSRAQDSVVLIRSPGGLGSGVVISPEGYLLTNNHVISGQNELTVTVFENTTGGLVRHEIKDVSILALSSALDLALLKIELPEDLELHALPVARTDSLHAGDAVWAMGSPLGLERSVATGIVSLPNRLIDDRLYVQTTAQINPGNSGGPLVNAQGEVVGISNMKIASLTAEGLGFAIPVDTIEFFLKNRDAFAYDSSNMNNGFRYFSPPSL